MALEVRWEAASETGNVRQVNEDAWGAWRLERSSGDVLFAVADGMGGHPGGEVASRLAVQACLDGLAGAGSESGGPDLLGRLFQLAHARLKEKAREEPGLERMGTTLTLLLLREDGGWVGHLGDSRLLWSRGGQTGLVTTDHSAAWAQVESGRLSIDQAERDPAGSLLTRHLGPLVSCEPDLPAEPLAVEANDRFLLCTDGLGKVVPIERVARTLASLPIREAISSLVEEVLAGGAPDNVTLVLVEVGAARRPSGASRAFGTLRYRFESSP